METFLSGVHLNYQNHFEDTPREAARVNTLAASLLLGPKKYKSTIYVIEDLSCWSLKENCRVPLVRQEIPERLCRVA